jgi:hypothetical protein
MTDFGGGSAADNLSTVALGTDIFAATATDDTAAV